MAMSLNKATVIGYLGADPETRFLPSGDAITTISVATSERWVDKNTGEDKESTEWHRITFFRGLAKVAADYLQKGSLVYVEGPIKTKRYTDKDGIERYTTGIKGERLNMLGPGKGGKAPENHPADDSDSNEIPF